MSGTQRSEFEVLAAALAVPETERRAWLTAECKGDTERLARLEQLLSQGEADSTPSTPLLEQMRAAARELWTRKELDLDQVNRLLDLLASRPTAIDRYEIHEEIGKGGAGRVFRVWDKYLHRELAMKVLEDESRSAPSARALRFLREAHVTAQLEHPAIVSVHDLGWKSDSELFFTMDLVRQRRFVDLIEDGTNVRTLVAVLQRASEAAAYAHDRGVLHRDISPRNIMTDAFGAVFLVDWGLARSAGSLLGPESESTDRPETQELTGVTLPGSVFGTLAYAAPERVDGRSSTLEPSADVYSLGAVLYHALTGAAPYAVDGASTKQDLQEQIKHGPPVALLARAGAVPPELAAICNRAMSREPAKRYRDADGFASDLQAWIERREVSAYRGGALYRITKWTQRRPGIAGTIAASVLLSSVVSVVAALRIDAKNRQVREESRVAESTTSFLEELFAASSLFNVKAEDATLQSVLNEGVRRLDDTSVTPPVRARLQGAIGTSLIELGHVQSGAQILRSAYEWTTENRPDDLARIANLKRTLGQILHYEGRREEAQETFAESVELYERSLGPDHSDTISAVAAAARYIEHDGSNRREQAYLAVYERSRSALGDRNQLTLLIRRDLASFYAHSSQFQKANSLLDDLIDDMCEVFGEEHPHTLSMWSMQAKVLTALGEPERGLEVYRRVRDRRAELYGEYSPVTANAENDVAIALLGLGRFAEAYVLQERLAEFALREFGPESGNGLSALNNQALAAARLGMHEDADRLFRRVFWGRVKLLGPADRLVAQTYLNWGTNDALWGCAERAEDRFLAALALFESSMGWDYEETLNTRRTIGIHLKNEGRYEEAEPFLLDALDSSCRVFGAEQPQTLRIIGLLAEVYRLWGRTEDADGFDQMGIDWSVAEQ